ncbi:N-acetyltransferase [Bacillus sp. UMB0899]|nr:N-acetyltransferase [Bacillus sp. UMB0899]
MIENYIEALDIAYVSSFATKLERSWGYLFYNENQPNYYDANHAHISTYNGHYEEIINEVIAFYKEKNIIPRFYLSNYEGQAEFLELLKNKGFSFEEFESPVQLWKRKIDIEPNSIVTIEEVTSDNMQDAIHIECQIPELGGSIREKAFKEEFSQDCYIHYLLKYNGTACSTACIFLYEQDARLESVATIKEYRGKGLIGQLIHYIQEDMLKKQVDRLWVHPINERVEKVYQKSGFDTILNVKSGHAFLGGKSIKDIQNGL